MNTIYVICAILVIKGLYTLLHKKDKNKNRIPKASDPIVTTKNKWLYPEEEFGIMEKRVVYESKKIEYDSSKNEDSFKRNNINFTNQKREQSFEIFNAAKEVKRKGNSSCT
jgi:hypothetical protein